MEEKKINKLNLHVPGLQEKHFVVSKVSSLLVLCLEHSRPSTSAYSRPRLLFLEHRYYIQKPFQPKGNLVNSGYILFCKKKKKSQITCYFTPTYFTMYLWQLWPYSYVTSVLFISNRITNSLVSIIWIQLYFFAIQNRKHMSPIQNRKHISELL